MYYKVNDWALYSAVLSSVCWVLDYVRTWKLTKVIQVTLSAGDTEFAKEMIVDNSRKFAMNYDIFKQRGWDGRLGKTAKFWIM